ncbi:MAG: VWA domain-containing protein [Verrucomicrobiota bacterium]|nr:VWA domain-containing protein [Verrucomicrobiota bacterium]
MRFAQPQLLWLLIIFLPSLCLFLFWCWRQKQKLITQFVQSRLLANLTVGVSQRRQKFRLILLVMAVAFLLLALARPQFGFYLEEARQQGLDIIVAMDTSKSMLATDVSPDRLTRAKLAVFDLMKQAKSDRLGLIAFAGSAFLQCPLTLDEEAFRQSVEALDVNIIPQGGTALAEAIQTAATAFEKNSDNHKVLVLFTDGEDHDSGAEEAVEKAAASGLRIFTIGVGSAEGELLRVKDEQGNSSFLKDDQGNAVKSRLNETLLQKIATKAHGFYLPLQGANPMEILYSRGLAPLPKSEATTKLVRNYREQFKWPLSLAIALLVFELFLPQRKRVRRTAAMAQAANPEFKKAVAILILFLVPLAGFSSLSSALKKYEAGKFRDSLSEYQKLARQKTNDFRLNYNAGAAAYRAKELEAAQKHFSEALVSPDLQLQEKAYYNLGNTLFQRGEPQADLEKKKEDWEQAIKNYENALKLNSQDADAKHNRDFVKMKLEELKKQEQQKNQQSKNDKSPNDKKDQKDQKKQDKNDKGDKQDKDQKEDQQKKDSAKQDKNSQEQNEKQKQEQKKSEEAKKEKEKQDKTNQAKNQKPEENKPDSEPEQAANAVPGKMTKEQADQFLEMMKQEDKPLVFAPPQKPKTSNRPIKDW